MAYMTMQGLRPYGLGPLACKLRTARFMAMIIPASLTHLDVSYDMRHLFRQRHGFEWRTREGLQVNFDVEVRTKITSIPGSTTQPRQL
jgi:hypothetical protein